MNAAERRNRKRHEKDMKRKQMLKDTRTNNSTTSPRTPSQFLNTFISDITNLMKFVIESKNSTKSYLDMIRNMKSENPNKFNSISEAGFEELYDKLSIQCESVTKLYRVAAKIEDAATIAAKTDIMLEHIDELFELQVIVNQLFTLMNNVTTTFREDLMRIENPTAEVTSDTANEYFADASNTKQENEISADKSAKDDTGVTTEPTETQPKTDSE